MRSEYCSSLSIPKQVVAIPGFRDLALCVYGVVKAENLSQKLQQGFFVLVKGAPTARAELPSAERSAVQALLASQFPQHAAI